VLNDRRGFIIRASLLRILKEKLLEHFADRAASEKYFGAGRSDELRIEDGEKITVNQGNFTT
jgi:hypothetical protein